MRQRKLMGAALAVGATAALAACTSIEGSSGGSSDAAASTSATQQSTSAPSTTAATPTESTSGDAPSATSSSRDVGAEISSASAAFGGGQRGLVSTKIGQEAKTSKLSVKLSTVTDPVPASGSSVFKPGPGKKWVAVTMTVTNVGAKPVNFSPSMCVDAKTDTNGSASVSLFGNHGSPMDSSTLQKGDVTVGDVTFEIPEKQKLKSVDVRCSLDFGGDQRTIRVDLSK